MKIFLSWSGVKSHKVALILEKWIPRIIQSVKPYVSSEMSKGIKWDEDIGKQLEENHFGIICLTKENLKSEWIHFEAGALSKTKGFANVCTFLLDINPTDVKPPLASFQSTKNEKGDIYKLVQTINSKLSLNNETSLEETFLNETFETFFHKLDTGLSEIKGLTVQENAEIRTDKELLEEILQNVRGLYNFQDQIKKFKSYTLKFSIRGNENNFNRALKLLEDNNYLFTSHRMNYDKVKDIVTGYLETPNFYNYETLFNLLKLSGFIVINLHYF